MCAIMAFSKDDKVLMTILTKTNNMVLSTLALQRRSLLMQGLLTSDSQTLTDCDTVQEDGAPAGKRETVELLGTKLPTASDFLLLSGQWVTSLPRC